MVAKSTVGIVSGATVIFLAVESSCFPFYPTIESALLAESMLFLEIPAHGKKTTQQQRTRAHLNKQKIFSKPGSANGTG